MGFDFVTGGLGSVDVEVDVEKGDTCVVDGMLKDFVDEHGEWGY